MQVKVKYKKDATALLLKALKLALMEFDRISYQKKADPAILGELRKVVRMVEATRVEGGDDGKKD